VQLTLDRVILRAADPAAALEDIVARTGAPVLVPVHDEGPFRSGIVRAGVDIEVLAVGEEPPPRTVGYGLGFTADVTLEQASDALRRTGRFTSSAAETTVDGRTWAAFQVRGLLPDPFRAPFFRRERDAKERMTELITAALVRIPPVARASRRRAASSMVVVTEYRFDPRPWRAAVGAGPTAVEVEVGTGGLDWSGLDIAPGPLRLDPEGPPGVRRIVFESGAELRCA
jgi:hypothetical protein